MRARALDLGAHGGEEIREIDYFGLRSGAVYHGGAFSQHGSHQQVFGARDGDHVSNDARAFQLLAWISGSTSQVGWTEAWIVLTVALVLLGLLPLLTRWLAVLPLGTGQARALGLPLRASRTILILFAAGLTAAASLVVGPLSFAGLVAPHMARLLGFGPAQQHLLASILIGAGLMTGADWLSRIVSFPYQLPLGLFASLIGGPYLVWLLHRNR